MPQASIQHAGDGGVIGIVPRPWCQRSGLPPASHATVDQARIDGEAIIRAKAQTFHDAGTKTLDQHIGLGNQFHDHGLGRWMFQIDAEGFLASVGDGFATTAEELRSKGAAATFEQGNVGPHVGQQHATERAGTNPGKFDDLDARKWAARW